jgi:hypothetical protein
MGRLWRTAAGKKQLSRVTAAPWHWRAAGMGTSPKYMKKTALALMDKAAEAINFDSHGESTAFKDRLRAANKNQRSGSG